MPLFRRRDVAFLALLFVFSFIPAVVGLLRLPELLGGPSFVPPNPRAVVEPVPIILHILGSSIFCLAGALQFLPGLRHARPGLHRGLGRIVALAGLASALSGLWMTLAYPFPQALQGPLLLAARSGVSLAMAGLILHAVIAIRGRKVDAHRAAMIRAYAIAQGASTQTALLIASILATGIEPSGFPRDLVMVAAWIINLAIAEALIHRTRRPRGPAALAAGAG
ncbi:MAG: DUF2306 domain-containing protein [Rubricella sp.]